MFKIRRTKNFSKKLRKLSEKERKRIIEFEKQLAKEPFQGKPLGFAFFREKKFDGKRVLYIIYTEEDVVLLTTITNKKSQQKHIDFAKENFEALKEFIHQ